MSAMQIVILSGAAILVVGLLMMLEAYITRGQRNRRKPLPPVYSQGWRIDRYAGCITCEGAEGAGALTLHQRRDHGAVRYVDTL